jgi:hypothetical protein
MTVFELLPLASSSGESPNLLLQAASHWIPACAGMTIIELLAFASSFRRRPESIAADHKRSLDPEKQKRP